MKTYEKRVMMVWALLLWMGTLASASVIAPSVAAVSSENPHGFKRDADNTVNGSGLHESGTHVAGEAGLVWTTLGNAGATDFAPYIVYDLGAPMDLTAIRIWNYNTAHVLKAPASGQAGAGELSTLNTDTTLSIAGADLVAVSTSVDGIHFTSRGSMNFKQAPGRHGYTGERLPFNVRDVRFIRFDIKTNHDGAVFDGTGERLGLRDRRGLTGLSEVRFESVGLLVIRTADNNPVVREGGEGIAYAVRLAKKPAIPVLIKAVPSDRQIVLNGAPAGMAVDVRMDQSNWNTWQDIKVSAADDNVFDPAHASVIRHFMVTGQGSETVTDLGARIDIAVLDNEGATALNTGEDIVLKDPDKRMEWWYDARYYWFIHWNPASLKGTEISWSRNAGVPKAEYDQLHKQFNPTEFDADEWVRIAKAAGFKTMVLVTKHHDGFCMWDTKQTDYNIMNTPFGRDIVKELSEACKRQNFRFSIYYSVMDWYQPDWSHYYAGGPGYQLPAGQKPDVNRYNKYMKAQITELLSNYGPMGLLWWDGTDGRHQFAPDWSEKEATDLEAHTRALQPGIVMNNRVGHWDGHSLPGNWWVPGYGDYDSSEVGVSGFNIATPWEHTLPLGRTWSWSPNDNYKSAKDMIRYLVGIAGRDGNCLLNVSPPSTGKFEDHVVKRLTDIGNWLRTYGESYYGTRGGPYRPGNWGSSTRKDNKIYLHILSWPAGKLVLPAIDQTITHSWLMTGGEVTVVQSDSNITIDVPEYYRREIDTVVVLELDGKAMDITPR